MGIERPSDRERRFHQQHQDEPNLVDVQPGKTWGQTWTLKTDGRVGVLRVTPYIDEGGFPQAEIVFEE